MENHNLSGENRSFWEDNEVDKNVLYKTLKIVILTILSLVLVLGVLGNGVVIWVTGFKMKKTANTVWYLNLAVANFLVTAFLPLSITERAMDFHWPFGKFMCKLNYTVLITNMFASVYILMVISVDRCVCVVWPVWAQNHRSVRKASCVSLGVWVLALIFSSPYIFFKTTFILDDGFTICYDNLHTQLWKFRFAAMTITELVLGFVIPSTVIVFCYSVIIYRLRRNRSLASHSGRPFEIIAAVIAVFFLCWVPYHIIQLIELVCRMLFEYSATLYKLINIGYPIAVCLAFLNSCLNPLLYVFMGQGFKDVFRSSVLKVLEKAFTEELPQTNTSANPGNTSHSKEFLFGGTGVNTTVNSFFMENIQKNMLKLRV